MVSIALEKYGAPTTLIMAFGMVANIVVARFTRLKYIYLSGHVTFYLACMVAIILSVAGFEGVQLIYTGSLALGMMMAIFPAIAQPYMRKIVGNDQVALAHTGTVGYVLSGWIGSLVGKGSKSTEEMNMPQNLSFLRDSTISISLTMMVIYLVLSVSAGKEYVESHFSNGQNYLVYSFIQAITFAAGVYIILQGVRLILAEIVPAFTGFSERLVPNARPALDCPIGNATGGKRGAIIGAFAHGILITFLPVALLPVLGAIGLTNTTFSDTDFGVAGIVLGNMARFMNPGMITATITGIFAVLVIYNFIGKKKVITE